MKGATLGQNCHPTLIDKRVDNYMIRWLLTLQYYGMRDPRSSYSRTLSIHTISGMLIAKI